MPDGMLTNSRYLVVFKTTQYLQPPVHFMPQPLIPNKTMYHVVRLDNGEIAFKQHFEEPTCLALTDSHLIAFGSHRISTLHRNDENTAYNMVKIDLGVGTMDFKRLDASPKARGISGTQFNGKLDALIVVSLTT